MFTEADRPFEYKLIRRKRKTIGISVSHEDGVVVTAPKWVSLKQIRDLLDKKTEWIMQRLRMIEEAAGRKPKVFETGEILLYQGEKYLIKILQGKGKVQMSGSLVEVYYIASNDAQADQSKLRGKIEAWYKDRAREVFGKRIEHYSTELGVKPKKLLIKEQKTRWGSCSSKGNINLNWRLIMALMGIIDYVVVHELAHLKHMNHSKEFWATVESVLPDFKARRKWLKQNNLNLMF